MSRNGLHILRPERPDAVDVLLVEDDEAIAGSLGEALHEDGWDVARASNGHEALDLLRGGLRPSVILLDLMMPVMDGWDFRQQQLLDAALKDIPVVVVTAAGFSRGTIRTQFGNVDVLPKPVPYGKLLEMLDRMAGSASSAA